MSCGSAKHPCGVAPGSSLLCRRPQKPRAPAPRSPATSSAGAQAGTSWDMPAVAPPPGRHRRAGWECRAEGEGRGGREEDKGRGAASGGARPRGGVTSALEKPALSGRGGPGSSQLRRSSLPRSACPADLQWGSRPLQTAALGSSGTLCCHSPAAASLLLLGECLACLSLPEPCSAAEGGPRALRGAVLAPGSRTPGKDMWPEQGCKLVVPRRSAARLPGLLQTRPLPRTGTGPSLSQRWSRTHEECSGATPLSPCGVRPAGQRGTRVPACRVLPPLPGDGSPHPGHCPGQGPLGSPAGHTGLCGQPATGGRPCVHSPAPGQVQHHLHGQVEPDGLSQAVPSVPAPRTVVLPAG